MNDIRYVLRSTVVVVTVGLLIAFVLTRRSVERPTSTATMPHRTVPRFNGTMHYNGYSYSIFYPVEEVTIVPEPLLRQYSGVPGMPTHSTFMPKAIRVGPQSGVPGLTTLPIRTMRPRSLSDPAPHMSLNGFQ
jgi:hypothetical protein